MAVSSFCSILSLMFTLSSIIATAKDYDLQKRPWNFSEYCSKLLVYNINDGSLPLCSYVHTYIF